MGIRKVIWSDYRTGQVLETTQLTDPASYPERIDGIMDAIGDLTGERPEKPLWTIVICDVCGVRAAATPLALPRDWKTTERGDACPRCAVDL